MKYDQATYDRLVTLFRRSPGNISAVAREMGVDRKVVRRAWEKGWQTWLGTAKPIKLVIADERDRARAEALDRVRRDAELAEAERERRAAAVAESLREEAELLGYSRRALLRLGKMVEVMGGVMHVVSKVVQDAVIDPATGQLRPNPNLKPLEASRIVRDFSAVAGRVAYASQVVIELGRADRGDTPLAQPGAGEMDDQALIDNMNLVADVRDYLRELDHDPTGAGSSGAADPADEPEPGDPPPRRDPP